MARWVEPSDIPGPKGQEFITLKQEEWGESLDAMGSDEPGVPINLISCLLEEIGYQCVRYRKSGGATPEGQTTPAVVSPEPELIGEVRQLSQSSSSAIFSATVKALGAHAVVEGMAPKELLELCTGLAQAIGENLAHT